MAAITLTNPNTGSINPTQDFVPVNDAGAFIDSFIKSSPTIGQTEFLNAAGSTIARFDATNDIITIGNPAITTQEITQDQTANFTGIKDDLIRIFGNEIQMGEIGGMIMRIVNTGPGNPSLHIDGTGVISTTAVVPTSFVLRFIHNATTFYIPLYR
jgi:hypothetical protein